VGEPYKRKWISNAGQCWAEMHPKLPAKQLDTNGNLRKYACLFATSKTFQKVAAKQDSRDSDPLNNFMFEALGGA